MKKIFLALIIFFIAFSAQAALAPEYRNLRDFEVMVKFIKKHPRVISTLTSIDFKNHTVYFGTNCEAAFVRKDVFRTRGWVGPAPDLEFKVSNCDVDKY